MIIDGYQINSFTKFSEVFCIKVLSIIQREFGEVGDFLVEDDEVSFRVSRGFFENAPSKIIYEDISLNLIEKSDYLFSLGYKVGFNNFSYAI
jgi:hypothetical protein